MEISVKALYDSGFEYIPIPDDKAPLILNQLMIHEMMEDFILNSIDPSIEQILGMREFQDLIKSILDQQININIDLVKEANKLELLRTDFLDQVNTDKLLKNNYDNVKDYTKQFYDIGKEKGFSQLQVKEFVSQVDTHALFNLTNYNFGLIKNVSDDVTRQIRKEVWQGVSRDESVVQIAERIKKTGIEPIETINGRKITVDQRASMIARTESTRARNQGLINSYLQYGIGSFNSVVVRTAGTCNDCLDIEAKGPYDIKKDSDKIPPHHTRCNCHPEPAEEPNSEPKDPNSFPDLVSGENVNVNPNINFGKQTKETIKKPNNNSLSKKYDEKIEKNMFKEYKGSELYKESEDYISRTYINENITIRKTTSNKVQKLLNHDDILKEFKSWPSPLKKNINSINVSKNVKGNFREYVEGFVRKGSKDIHILEIPKQLRPFRNTNDYMNTVRHESFHVFDNFKPNGVKQINRLSNSQEWTEAIKKDNEFFRLNSNKKIFHSEDDFYSTMKGTSPSKYGANSPSEDFAESGRRFLDPKDKNFPKQFPNRYKYIKDQLKLI